MSPPAPAAEKGLRVRGLGDVSLPYALGAGLVGATLLLRLLLQSWVGVRAPYIQFFPAILAAAWWGGLGPGLVTTALSTVAAWWISPALEPRAGDHALSATLLLLTGAGIAWLSHRLQSSERAQRDLTAVATARAERLDAILNTAVDGIVVIDAHGRIESFNRGAEQMFGYPASEVVGRNVSLLMPSPEHEEHDRYFERYLATGQAGIIGVGRELVARRRDGTRLPIHLSVGEMRIAGERKFTGMIHDLTRRDSLAQELRASDARWRAVIDSAVDGIVVIDSHGRIESFNPAAERLFGYAEQEVVGRNVSMLMPSPYREEHDGYLSRYLATGRPKIIGSGREVEGRRKDGSTFPLHLSVGGITIGGERKFTGILHDLSDRLRIEQRLREQAALARLGEMSAVIAHEVKNPLAAVRGAVQMIGSRLPKGGGDWLVVQEIVNRIDSLDEMVKDLLLFARTPKPRPSPTDVVPLVATTARLLSRDPSLSGIHVQVEGAAPPVPADAEMLKIVVHNLLVNSAHAMNGQGRIRVDVGHTDHLCEIAIMDSGPGIPDEIRDKVFAPFFTTKVRGTGLGLATAKRLIEAHNGEIAVDCPPGGGTTFVVRLPIAAIQAERP